MIVKTDRFGSLDIPDDESIAFPNGLVGFPNDDQFVLVVPRDEARIAWLQSTRTPSLALPVVSLHETAMDVPFDDYVKVTHDLGLADDVDDCAVMLVVTTGPNRSATVNLLAPILVNAATRVGVQALLDLDPQMLTMPLCLRPVGEPAIESSEETQEPEEAPMAMTKAVQREYVVSAAE
jgi:flagellar assembly factor FliW